MAALADIRHNATLKRFICGSAITAKPTKVTLTAVMRKLTILLSRHQKDPQINLIS